MQYALDETNRRRAKQEAWNEANGITPESIRKDINDVLESVYERGDHVTPQAGGAEGSLVGNNFATVISDLERPCRTPRPIWNLRKRPGCAMKSAEWKLPSLGLNAPGVRRPSPSAIHRPLMMLAKPVFQPAHRAHQHENAPVDAEPPARGICFYSFFCRAKVSGLFCLIFFRVRLTANGKNRRIDRINQSCLCTVSRYRHISLASNGFYVYFSECSMNY